MQLLQIIIHKDFDPITLNNDIAVLKVILYIFKY